jgi:hypothetical protein
VPRLRHDTHGWQPRRPCKSDEISLSREQQREITTSVAGARQNIGSEFALRANHRPASISDGVPCVPGPVNWRREQTHSLELEDVGSALRQQRHSLLMGAGVRWHFLKLDQDCVS